MSDPVPSILKRMAGAGRQPPDHGVVSPFGAMRLALSRAAQDVVRAPLVGGHVTDLRITLRTMGDMLPPKGLWVLLQGRGCARGLICADASLLAALVQALTTGRITGAQVAEREPTQTDALLVRKVLVSLLDTFALRLTGHSAEDWARGYQPRDRLTDPARLPHVLQDVVYRGLSMEVDIGNGLRTGQLLLILPRHSGTAAELLQPEAEQRAAFNAALNRSLAEAPAQLDAELHRMPMTLAEINGLDAGSILPLPRAALKNVALVDCSGRVMGRAHLGQSGGYRAVRLTDVTGTAKEPAAEMPGNAAQDDPAAPAAAPAPAPRVAAQGP